MTTILAAAALALTVSVAVILPVALLQARNYRRNIELVEEMHVRWVHEVGECVFAVPRNHAIRHGGLDQNTLDIVNTMVEVWNLEVNARRPRSGVSGEVEP